MANTTYYLDQGEVPSTPIEFLLKDAEGTLVNWSLVDHVVLHMDRVFPDDVHLHLTATPGNTPGLGHYDWQPGDSDAPGYYHGKVEVFWNSGKSDFFPKPGFLDIYIEPALA